MNVVVVKNLHIYKLLEVGGGQINDHTSYNMALIITSIKAINPLVILPLSMLILVLLLVSFITVMFHSGCLISLTHLCVIAFLSLYIVLIDVLINSAVQLQECLINLLTYLLTFSSTPTVTMLIDYIGYWESCHRVGAECPNTAYHCLWPNVTYGTGA